LAKKYENNGIKTSNRILNNYGFSFNLKLFSSVLKLPWHSVFFAGAVGLLGKVESRVQNAFVGEEVHISTQQVQEEELSKVHLSNALAKIVTSTDMSSNLLHGIDSFKCLRRLSLNFLNYVS